MIVPDLNLLIYAHNDRAPWHAPAKRWWEGLMNATERVGVPWVVSIGFVRLMTSPAVLARPVSPAEAIEHVAAWYRFHHVFPVNPGADHLAHFASNLAAAGVGAQPGDRRTHRRRRHGVSGRGPFERLGLQPLSRSPLAEPALNPRIAGSTQPVEPLPGASACGTVGYS